MGFWEKIKRGIQTMMAGRYGGDQFGVTLLYAALVIMLLGAIFNVGFLLPLSYAVMIYGFVRMFSKNVAARRKENAWFLSKTGPYVLKGKQAWARFKNRKSYAYFRCPKCKSWIKLPRGVGEVTVTCGKCGNQFPHKA